MTVPYYGVGCTHKFRTNPVRKDGITYNLTTAVVNLVLTDPDGIISTKVAALDDAVNGIASYTTIAADLNKAGSWSRQWKVTDGGGAVILKGNPVTFQVGA